MIEHFNLNTQVVWTQRGCHLYFKKPEGYSRVKGICALGFEVEYKHKKKKPMAVTIKRNGKVRPIDNEGLRMSFPNFFKSSPKYPEMLGLGEGDGRNDRLFRQRKLLSALPNWQSILTFINDNVFAEPLEEKEMETLTRDMVIEAEKDGEAFMADCIMREYRVVSYCQQLYYHKDGEYIGDEDKLKRIVFKYCTGKKTKYVDEVIKQMEYRSRIIPNNKTFDIKLKNGILRNGQFLELDYTDFTPYSIDIDYDENAETVEIVDNYLNHLTDNDQNYRDRLLEILGHCLIVDKEFKRLMGKFFIFVGDGGNGKGTLLAVIRSILNSKNCAGLSIRNLTDEKYLNVLQGKLANLGDDIQDEPINNEQMKMLKNISTCDFVEIRKLYKNSNSVELTPTLIFTSNHILKSFEKGESYKRRVDWLPMYSKPKKKERDFISRLTCEKALRYWVKLIVEGYMRLYQNQRFTDCEKVNKFNEIYHSENNTALLYIGDFEIKDFIGKRPPSIYEDYVTWCEENGLNSQSKKLFASTVKDVLNLTVRNKRINGKTARVYSEE
jgi:putative DNA primase/helicase